MPETATPAAASQPAATETAQPAKTTSPVAVDSLFSEGSENQNVEAKPEVKKDNTAKQMAMIAREQKRIAAEKAELQKEREAAKQAQSELSKWQSLQTKIKENPLAVLNELGMDYNKLIEAELQRQAEEADPTKRKIREIEQQLSAEREAKKQLEIQREKDNALSLKRQYVSNIKNFIDQNGEQYELLKVNGAETDVFDKMQDLYLKGNKKITVSEVCDLLEKEFEEATLPLKNIKKIQKLFANATPAEQKEIIQILDKQTPKTKSKSTLSNSQTQPMTSNNVSKEERRERAWAALYGKSLS